jgi:membrane protease YdiL (CAAX protease family)
MNPWTATQILLLGSIFGLMAWKSNSIWPSAIAHAINNGLAVIFIHIPQDKAAWYSWHGHVNPLLILAAIAGLYFGFKCFFRACK